MNGIDHSSFLSRLLFVLGERDRYPWGLALGLTRGTINRISDGHVPGPEMLTVISRAENVSINWLLEGIGAPFLVARCQSDDEARDLLRRHLDDEPAWAVHLVTSEPQFALVLTQPCRIQSGKQIVDYLCVEIISGAGSSTVRVAIESRASHPLLRLRVDSASLHRLGTGWMGNVELLGWRGVPGILNRSRPMDEVPPVLAAPRAAEPRAAYGLPNDEIELLDLFRELPENKKQAVLTLLKP